MKLLRIELLESIGAIRLMFGSNVANDPQSPVPQASIIDAVLLDDKENSRKYKVGERYTLSIEKSELEDSFSTYKVIAIQEGIIFLQSVVVEKYIDMVEQSYMNEILSIPNSKNNVLDYIMKISKAIKQTITLSSIGNGIELYIHQDPSMDMGDIMVGDIIKVKITPIHK